MPPGYLSHPYLLDSIDQLDEQPALIARKYITEGNPLEGIFVSPANTYLRRLLFRSIPQKVLLFSRNGILQITYPMKKGGIFLESEISANEILYTKNSQVLLYGKLEIWDYSQSNPVIDIEYNTVSHRLLSPLLRNLIKKTWNRNPSNAIEKPICYDFQDFIKISFSFYHGLTLEGLQKDENLIAYIFQPEIFDRVLGIFKRKNFPTSVIAFTDQQIIFLQQDLSYQTHNEWIFTYIPRFRVNGYEVEPLKNTSKVKINLASEPREIHLSLCLEEINLSAWKEAYDAWVG
jgi:hypothetical protein